MRTHRSSILVASVLGLVLAACGGDGGGGAPVADVGFDTAPYDAGAPCTPTAVALLTESATTALRETPVRMQVAGCPTVDANLRTDDERYFRAAPAGGDTFEAYVALHPGSNAFTAVAFTGPTETEIGALTLEYTPTAPTFGPDSATLVATVVDAASGAPIPDAVAFLRDVPGELVTGADGAFAMPTPSGGRYLLTVEREGYTLAQRRVDVASGQALRLPDIRLVAHDSVTATITPEAGGTLSNSAGNVHLVVPPGAVRAAVDIGGVAFPEDETLPGPLPDSSRWTQAFDLSPDGVRFDTPAEVRVANELGFAPGTSVPVGYFDRTVGNWVPETMGVVSEDGEWIVASVRHFSPYDCNFPARERGRAGTGTGTDDDCRDGTRGSSIISDMTGQLTLFAPVARTLSHNADRPYRLVYESERATGDLPVVLPVDVGSVADADSIVVRFGLGGLTHEVRETAPSGDETYVAATVFAADEPYETALGTGVYAMALEVVANATSTYETAPAFGAPGDADTGVATREPVPYTTTRTLPAVRVDDRDSALGAGWSFAEEERLIDGASVGVTAWRRAGRTTLFATGVAGPPIARAVDPFGGQVFDIQGLADGRILLVSDQGLSVAVDPEHPESATPLGSATPGLIAATVHTDPSALQTIVSLDSAGTLTWRGLDGIVTGTHDLFTVFTEWSLAHPDDPIFFLPGTASPVLAVDRDGRAFIALEGLGLIAITPPGEPIAITQYPLLTLDETVPNVSGLVYREDEHALYLLNRFVGWVQRYDLTARNESTWVPLSDAVDFGGELELARMDATADGSFYVLAPGGAARVLPNRARVPLAGATFGPGVEWPCIPVAVFEVGTETFLACVDPVDGGESTTIHRMDPAEGRSLTSDHRLRVDGASTYVDSEDTSRVFDADGRLTERSTWRGTEAFEYTGGLLTRYVDAGGYELQFVYDGGVLARIEDATGPIATVTVDEAGDLVELTDDDGVVSTFAYDDHRMVDRGVGTPPVVDATVHYTWGDGTVTETRVSGRAATALRSVLAAAGADGLAPADDATAVAEPPVDEGDRVERGFDLEGRVDTIDVAGDRWTVLYQSMPPSDDPDDPDTLAHLTSDDGYTITVATRGGDVRSVRHGEEIVYRRSFDDDGRVAGIFSAEAGDECHLDYDDDGRILEVTCLTAYAGYEYDDEDDVPERVLDGNWNPWTFTRDALGNITGVNGPAGYAAEYRRDDRGFITRYVEPGGADWVFERDGRGMMTAFVDPADNRSTFEYRNAATCDGCAEHRSEYPSAVTNALGDRWEYEARGDGLHTRITSPEGRVRTFRYDAMGRLRATRNGTASAEATIDYDDNGRLESLTTDVYAFDYRYDAEDRLTHADATVTTGGAERDGVSLTRSYEDAFGGETTTTETVTVPGGPSWSVTWTERVDAHSITAFTSSVGHDFDLQATHTAYFDGLNANPGAFSGSTSLGFSLNWGGGDYGERLAYDADDSLVSDVDIYHDDLMRIESWYTYAGVDSWTEDGLVFTFDGATPRVASASADTGTYFPTTSYQYTDQGWLRRYDATFPGTTYAAWYSYDEGGRMIVHSELGSLGYDDDGQLLDTDLHEFRYTDAGERRRMEKGPEGWEYFWDATGLLTRVEHTRPALPDEPDVFDLEYDATRRLTRLTNQRTGVIRHFVWLGEILLAELDADGDVVWRYVPSERLDKVSVINDGTTNYFVIDDPAGTVHRLVDRDGNVVARFDYDPWGRVLHSEGPLAAAPRRYRGALHIDELGLIYLRQRWYDPEVAQFISQDPIPPLSAYPHPYMYANNNPVYWSDPYGLCPDGAQTMFNNTRDAVVTGGQFLSGRSGPLAGLGGSAYVFARGLKGYDGTRRGNARAGMRNYASITGLDQSPLMRGAMNSFQNFSEMGDSMLGLNRRSDDDCDPRTGRRRSNPVFTRCP